MSIAAQFRDKYDIVLISADETVGKDPDHRRTMLMQALNTGDMMLVEKDYVQALFDTITELRKSK